MTTHDDRPNTALVIVDMQRGVVARAHDVERVVININVVIDKARRAGVPVIWVQHSDHELLRGSEEWEYVPELRRADDEPVVHKNFGDSFDETDLESLLAERKVGKLVVTGAQTDACIRSTLHGALVRGYDATLVEDAHTTDDLRPLGVPFGPADAIAYTNLYWSHTEGAGRTGGTVAAADVDFT